ncbi:hypothetical protein PINS_up003557 [Pythium insidiosum]|nr:hypothetical protein PINS_up003557 [Pythium insidiosum]
MTATDVVHPLASSRSSHMSRLADRRLVLYSLVGEPVEPQDEGKNAAPDKALNAFPVARDGDVVRLADVQRAFPLGGAFHFAFKNAVGAFVDLTNPSAVVPLWDNKIVARVTPLCACTVLHVSSED